MMGSIVVALALLLPDRLPSLIVKEGSEQDMIRYHMGLGMWMRNNWGLWGGSRLAKESWRTFDAESEPALELLRLCKEATKS